MKKSILLTICLALIGNTSFALDLFELGDCMKYGDRSPEDKRYYCFPMMKDLGEGELLYVRLNFSRCSRFISSFVTFPCLNLRFL